jgi:hypothetical protein
VWDIRSIVHPTDFSEASAGAFAHALRIALSAKAMLTLLHVAHAHAAEEWTSFPHVRQTLAAWGLMGEKESPDAIAKLGLGCGKWKWSRNRRSTASVTSSNCTRPT